MRHAHGQDFCSGHKLNCRESEEGGKKKKENGGFTQMTEQKISKHQVTGQTHGSMSDLPWEALVLELVLQGGRFIRTLGF